MNRDSISTAKRAGAPPVRSEPRTGWTSQVLVIANGTADSDALLKAMTSAASREPSTFTLIVPLRDSDPDALAAASEALARGLARARTAGLEVDGRLGPRNPVTASAEAFDRHRHDRIIISTLHVTSSKWLALDVPARIRRLTGAEVTHVEADAGRDRATADAWRGRRVTSPT
jgi:hypothetical protein